MTSGYIYQQELGLNQKNPAGCFQITCSLQLSSMIVQPSHEKNRFHEPGYLLGKDDACCSILSTASQFSAEEHRKTRSLVSFGGTMPEIRKTA